MHITFTKMQACGNDFVIIDQRSQPYKFSSEQLMAISDRHYGVGCDQIILLTHSQKADIAMKIYNADAGEAEACGNATRCVAKLIAAELKRSYLTIETMGGILPAWIEEHENSHTVVKIDMGAPRLKWQEIPLSQSMDTLNLDISNCQALPVSVPGLGQPSAVSMGNPHLIFFVDDIDKLPVDKLGPHFEHHEFFPQKTNVDFAEVVGNDTIKLRVWERGTGETLGCGSGACATLVAAVRRGLVSNEAKIVQRGGSMLISWAEGAGVLMKGDANLVFSGVLHNIFASQPK